MKFLIALAIIVVIIALILHISPTLTVIYDRKWTVKLKVLWFEFDIQPARILQKLLFKETGGKKKAAPARGKTGKKAGGAKKAKSQKPNYFQKLWADEGIVGILAFLSTLLQSASRSVKILIKGFHIYALYVKIIVGASDAAYTALQYGKICSYYYPLKGILTTQLRVDDYNEVIMPDYIAEENEYEFQLIAALSLGTVLKSGLAAALEFIKGTMQK